MAQPTDVVSLVRAKRRLHIGQVDEAEDDELAAVITTASEWLDDKCGPVVQRVIGGALVGRFASTAAAENTRFGMAALLFVGWLLRSQVLRVDQVDGYEVPAVAGGGLPVDDIRALLGDEWVDDEPGADPAVAVGSFRLGVWSSP